MRIIRYKLVILLFSLFIIHYSLLIAQDTWIQTYDPINWATNTTRDILWEYWYDPFGADGYNVRPHMAVCSDGGFAVTGYYIIEDGTGGWLEWQGYVLKTDSEGNFLWADKDTLYFMGENESRAIVETSDGSIINGGGGYMIKRDANGNRLWEQIIYGGIGAICNTNDGNIIITGGTQTGEFLLRKIDEDGNEIWNKDFMMGINWTSGKCIIQTSDEGFVITGSVSDEMADSDILIIKTNSLGDTLWTYRKDGYGDWDQGNWILENSENQLLCVGEIHPEPLTSRGYFAKFELDGELLHEEILDPEIGYNCWYAIDLPDENTYLVTAVPNIIKFDYDFNIVWVENEGLLPYYKKMDFGYLLYSNGVHLIRTDENIVSVSDYIVPETDEVLKIYPNPFNPGTTFSFNLPKDVNDGFLIIYNIKGQKVRQFSINNNTSEITWDGTDQNSNEISSGIYFATIHSDNSIYETKKLTLIK
jgi:hypothetical protein